MIVKKKALMLLACLFLLVIPIEAYLTELLTHPKTAIKGPELSIPDQCMEKMDKVFKRQTSRTLAGMVGLGWDGLTDTAKLPIFPINFNKCLATPDGQYLVPDNVQVIPRLDVAIDRTSTSYDSYTKYKIDVGVGFSIKGGIDLGVASATGELSAKSKVAKSHFSSEYSKAMVNKIEFLAYDVIGTEVDGFDPNFQDRLEMIAAAVDENNLLQGQYLAESLVADYGTMVVYKAVAGASVTMSTFYETDDSTDTLNVKTQLKSKMQASVMGLFTGETSISVDVDVNTESKTKTIHTETHVVARGGPPIDILLKPNATLTMDNLVGHNMETIPLHTLIHPSILGSKYNNSKYIGLTVQGLVLDAIKAYYKHNTIPGCIFTDYVNYNAGATVGDGSCAYAFFPKTIFGGFYQTCEVLNNTSTKNSIDDPCDPFQVKNHFPKDFQCGEYFDTIPLGEVFVTFKQHEKSETADVTIKISPFYCHTSYDFGENPEYSDEIYRSIAYFGGIYETDNIWFEHRDCPPGFHEYPFMYNLKICYSSHKSILKNKQVFLEKILIGGEEECDPNYSKYDVATIDGKNIFYCATVESTRDGSARLSPPPYVNRHFIMKEAQITLRKSDYVSESAKVPWIESIVVPELENYGDDDHWNNAISNLFKKFKDSNKYAYVVMSKFDFENVLRINASDYISSHDLIAFRLEKPPTSISCDISSNGDNEEEFCQLFADNSIEGVKIFLKKHCDHLTSLFAFSYDCSSSSECYQDTEARDTRANRIFFKCGQNGLFSDPPIPTMVEMFFA